MNEVTLFALGFVSALHVVLVVIRLAEFGELLRRTRDRDEAEYEVIE